MVILEEILADQAQLGIQAVEDLALDTVPPVGADRHDPPGACRRLLVGVHSAGRHYVQVAGQHQPGAPVSKLSGAVCRFIFKNE